MEEVYVNAEARDGTEVAELMQVFTEGPVYNDKFPVTSGLKKLYRDGDDEMIYTLSDKLREEGQKELVVNMLKHGLTPDFIADKTEMPLETIIAIEKSIE